MRDLPSGAVMVSSSAASSVVVTFSRSALSSSGCGGDAGVTGVTGVAVHAVSVRGRGGGTGTRTCGLRVGCGMCRAARNARTVACAALSRVLAGGSAAIRVCSAQALRAAPGLRWKVPTVSAPSVGVVPTLCRAGVRGSGRGTAGSSGSCPHLLHEGMGRGMAGAAAPAARAGALGPPRAAAAAMTAIASAWHVVRIGP
jgi:hypothetical protein